MPPIRVLPLIAAAFAGLALGADNSLTKQEKTDGWVLLFDGKTLNGWDSANPVTATPGRGRGKKGPPAAPQPGALPAVGSNPRACAGNANTPEGGSHWEVMHGMLSPCGDPAGYLSTEKTFRDFMLRVDFRTGNDTNSGVFVRSPQGIQGYE